MQPKVENARKKLMTQGKKKLVKDGYGGIVIAELTAACGMAAGTFYNYFKSKEEVFQAIQDENALRVRPRLRAERIRARSVEEFISGSFRTFFEYIATDRQTFAVIRRNADTMRVRMDTPEIIAGFDELRADIVKAIAEGIFPLVDADYLMAAAANFATALFMGGFRALPTLARPAASAA